MDVADVAAAELLEGGLSVVVVDVSFVLVLGERWGVVGRAGHPGGSGWIAHMFIIERSIDYHLASNYVGWLLG